MPKERLFECTGVASLLQPSAALVRRGGSLVGALAYSHEDFLGITGTVGLDGLASVLTELGSGNTTHAKVLVDPNG